MSQGMPTGGPLNCLNNNDNTSNKQWHLSELYSQSLPILPLCAQSRIL